MFIEILGLWGFWFFLFVGLHECGLFNLVNFQAPLLRGLEPKLQNPWYWHLYLSTVNYRRLLPRHLTAEFQSLSIMNYHLNT